jgi:hypothetical protein
MNFQYVKNPPTTTAATWAICAASALTVLKSAAKTIGTSFIVRMEVW